MDDVAVYSGNDALPFVEECARIHATAFAKSGGRGWSAQEFSDLLQRETVFLLKTTAGFLIGDDIIGEVEILTFAVHPAEQNAGIGTSILKKLDEVNTYRNVSKCILEVATDNIAARNLYRAFNFQEIAIRDSYYGSGSNAIAAIVMEKVFAST